jgi:hypothetical protein
VGTTLATGRYPNDLWCADYKGEFKLSDGPHCSHPSGLDIRVTWWARQDSNLRQRRYERRVLTAELQAHYRNSIINILSGRHWRRGAFYLGAVHNSAGGFIERITTMQGGAVVPHQNIADAPLMGETERVLGRMGPDAIQQGF